MSHVSNVTAACEVCGDTGPCTITFDKDNGVTIRGPDYWFTTVQFNATRPNKIAVLFAVLTCPKHPPPNDGTSYYETNPPSDT
jgi:hypothetical protein